MSAARKQMVGAVGAGRRTPVAAARKQMVGVGLALALVLFAGTRGVTAQAQPAPEEKMTPAQIEALFKARSDSARMHFTTADVQFMTGMIEHHGQALVMAAMAPTHGAGPSVRTLCERIINAQKDEIATMQAWLRDRGQPVPEVDVEGTMVRLRFPRDANAKANPGADQMPGMDMGGGKTMTMPGMLTPEQMAALDQARGTDFDRLFLQGMIQHHGGAITMVRDLWQTPGEGGDQMAFKLANDIQVDQATEIARMQLMLLALPAAAPSR